MATDRARLRVDVWCEDPRQETFIRHLLVARGFSKRRLEFHVAPRGRGAAERWVLEQYPEAMRRLRSRRYQRHLGLVVMRDGDRVGHGARRAEMDEALALVGLSERAADERVALPFPQWSIESWLLILLGGDAEEGAGDKRRYEARHGAPVDAALIRGAVVRWREGFERSASMCDAEAEVARLDG